MLIKDTDQQERSRPLSGDWFDCSAWCHEACFICRNVCSGSRNLYEAKWWKQRNDVKI